MAEETRRQRRDARRAAGQEPARGGAPVPAAAGPEGAAPVVDHGRRGGFIRESVAELRKVDWPDQKQVTTGSVVVIIACAIVGAYLWVNDLIWQRVVEAIL